MENRNKTGVLFMMLMVLIASVIMNVGFYKKFRSQQPIVKSDTVEVIRWDTVHHDNTVVKTEKVTKYVRVPDSVFVRDTVTNELTLPVVQRCYTDDSTYRAYVSGVKVDSFPRLDSVMFRQKTVERVITNTVKEKKHWKFGVGINGGISVITGKPDITAGVNWSYTF